MPRSYRVEPKPRRRKQHVVWRTKRREAIQHRFRGVFFGGLVLGGLIAFGFQIAMHGSTWTTPYLLRHTPAIELQAPETLAALPLLKQIPAGRFIYWIPGADWPMRRRWLKDYPAVAKVEFEKHFLNNRIIAHLSPRVPLVHWEDRGMDKEGIVFTLASSGWTPLPKALFPPTERLRELGRWLAQLSHQADLWSQVVAVSQDLRGEMWLDMEKGTRVAWGAPDAKMTLEKARCLALVLNDAHARLSGAATADIRFFDDGRVIVRPKSAV